MCSTVDKIFSKFLGAKFYKRNGLTIESSGIVSRSEYPSSEYLRSKLYIELNVFHYYRNKFILIDCFTCVESESILSLNVKFTFVTPSNTRRRFYSKHCYGIL